MNNHLSITLLGTGTSQGIPVIGCTCKVCTSGDPRDSRLRTAAFIQCGNTGLAIDIGPDFRQQMLANAIHNVHAVLLTHEHNDHVSGLDDIRPINFLHRRDIPIYGQARSLEALATRFPYAFDPEYIYPGKPRVFAKVLRDDPFEVDGVEVIPVPVDHGDMIVYGYRVGNLAYVTDAKHIPDQSLGLLENLDVLVLNALRFEPHATHLNIDEAYAIYQTLKPRQCFLTHISHDMGTHLSTEARLPEGLELGYDGLKVILTP